jgi:NDP-sugar pyrophosphorylase family protein
VIPNPARDHYNGVVAGDDGIVRAFIPKGHVAPSWHFVGIQIVAMRVLASLPDNTPAETVSGIYRDLVASAPGRVRVHAVDAPFHDVGTAADYVATCRAFGGVDARGNIIWPGARVDAGARVSDSIVAGDIVVPADFVAEHEILMPASLARPGDRCEIVGDVAKFRIERTVKDSEGQ